MKPVYSYKSISAEVQPEDVLQGIITGYFSAFNVKDAYGDTVKPGAFTKTIAEQGPNSKQPRIKYLLNHDVCMPIGKILSLEEDAFGLKYTAQIGSNEAGEDFMEMVESGLITEHSIGFQTIKSLTNNDTGERDLLEIKLWEGSALTGWGVNQFTPIVSLKSEDDEKRILKRLERLEKFCRNSTATDECIEALLLEVKQLTQLSIDLKSNKATKPEQDSSTQPENDKGINWNLIANQLITNQFSKQ